MTKSKRSIILFLLFLVIFASIGLMGMQPSRVNAQEGADVEIIDESNSNNEADVRALFVSLSISISGSQDGILATAKNDVTILPATIQVYVELYYSTTYYVDYHDMTLSSRNWTADLDMGQTLTTISDTEGHAKYWQAVMRYKVDNGAWETKHTDSIYYNENGERII